MVFSYASTPPPREVEAVLVWWLPRLRSLLGSELRCVLLGGGLALGGFEPGWSDLDVCVVLRGDLREDLAEEIGRLHAEAEQRFLVERAEGWRSTQLLEGPYLPHDLVGAVGATGRFLQVDTGSCRLAEGDPVPGFERYVLARHSLVLAGEPVTFAAPSRSGLAASQGWLLEHLAEPASTHSSIMLAGLLQESARSLVFWRDGVYLDKTAALEREIAADAAWSNACRVALDVRRAGSAEAAPRRTELERAYDRSALVLRAELEARLENAMSFEADS